MGCTTGVDTVNSAQVANEYSSLLSAYEQGLPGLSTLENQLTMQNITQDTPALLSLYTNQILPSLERSTASANTYARTADVNDVANLGGRAVSAIRGTNTAGSGLLDALTASANEGLAAGSQLNANDTRRISGQVRGDWASRGLGTSDPAALDEAMNLYGAGTGELAQRQNFGQAVYGNQKALTDEALGLVTGQSSVPSSAQSWLSGVTGLGTTTSNSGQSAAYDVLNTSYNAQSAANISEANNRSAVYSSLLSY